MNGAEKFEGLESFQGRSIEFDSDRLVRLCESLGLSDALWNAANEELRDKDFGEHFNGGSNGFFRGPVGAYEHSEKRVFERYEALCRALVGYLIEVKRPGEIEVELGRELSGDEVTCEIARYRRGIEAAK